VIEPEPRILREVSDSWGNSIVEIEFEGSTNVLGINSSFELKTDEQRRPLLGTELPLLPWRQASGNDVTAFAMTEQVEPSVQNFALEIAHASGLRARDFLDQLNRTLFDRTDRHIRADGAAHSPAHTLATRQGACRDLAVLFMAACRSVGIASRFVSGYQARSERADGKRYLHAWPEAFLPGTGWLGFDPTHGTPVADGHVALCAAPSQSATMPVEGGFYGSGVTSTLTYDVSISAQ